MSEGAANIGGPLATIEALRSHRLRSHENGVERLCAALCRAMGFDEGATQATCFAAGLHDVGKLAVAEAILEKPGKLDDEEWQIMRRHAAWGGEILDGAKDPAIALASLVAHRHHEHWDGSGYPDGLRGDAIPREARIVGLCDVYDAMRETRPYKRPFTHGEVVSAILSTDPTARLRATMFDPEIIRIFATRHDEFRAIYEGTRH